MKREEMKIKVLEFIRKNKQVSYAELEWLFEQNDFNYKGNLDALSGQCEHVIFWTGWNADAFDILAELMGAGLIHREPTTSFTYIMDGKTLKLPIVKKAISFKKDHWLPAMFCPGRESVKRLICSKRCDGL